MRKLSLNNLNLGAESLLQREQLKSVLGGYIQEQCPGGGIPCSCTGSDGSITVGCATSVEACWNFCD